MNDKDILAMTIAANAIWTDFAKLTVDVNIHPDTNLPISVEACVISNKGTVLMRGRDVPLTDGVPGKEDAMDQAWGSLKEKVAAEIIMLDRYAQTEMDKQASHYQSKIKHWKNMLTILYPQEG
jgi:hypothetical protein